MWLFVPSACVQDTQDLNLGSDSQECPPLPPVTWRGKLMRQRTWSRLWKKVPWARLLSSVTFAPLTLCRGVERWISSLLASHVSPTQQLGSESTSKTSDGSGPTLTGFFASYDAESCSWRMSQGSLFQGWDQFSEPWPAWGSMRNGESFERPMPGLLTDGRVSSSSGSTPTEDDPFSGDSWPTPDALARKRVNGGEIMSGPKKGEYIKDRPTLAALAVLWSSLPPHATEMDGDDGGVKADLSPEFVEALMGLRTGWSDCASSETESSPNKQPLPSSSSGSE